MRLIGFARAGAFRAAAEPWLAAAERDNNLLITAMVAAIQTKTPSRGWLVTSGEAPQLALFQTPSQYLLLSEGDAEAAGRAATDVAADLPGVAGPAPVAEIFAERWSERAGCAANRNGEMTFFTAEYIVPFRRPSGSFRKARADEFDNLHPLAVAAARDMNLPRPEQNSGTIAKGLRRAIAQGRQFVWEDGPSICAMASYVAALSCGGARIRGVYTPPEFRGSGYGTAVSGALAEWLLGSGQQWVSLFADNANPVSTGIYRRLGFQPWRVYLSVRFE
jgi:predicted GNAT family acetyltransferase